MGQTADDRLDDSLHEFLVWQADDLAGAARRDDIVGHIERRAPTRGRPGSMALAMALLVVGLLATLAVAATIGAPPRLPALVPPDASSTPDVTPTLSTLAVADLPSTSCPSEVDATAPRGPVPAVGPAAPHSRDGAIAMVARDGEGPVSIVLLDPDTGSTRSLARASDPSPDVQALGWSPDGRWLAFVDYAPQAGPFRRGCTSLSVVSVDGRQSYRVGSLADGPRLTSNLINDRLPFAWSPDGRWLAFPSDVDDPDSTDVRLEIAAIGEAGVGDRVAVAQGTDLASPAWSPTGASLAFAETSNGVRGLRSIEAGTTNLMELGAGATLETILGWSPDGTAMLAVGPGDRSDGDLFVVPTGGGPARRLDGDRQWVRQGLWSPDGSSIVYLSDDESLSDMNVEAADHALHVVRPDGSDNRAIPVAADEYVTPIGWAADSRQVLVAFYDTASSGDRAVYRLRSVSADGSTIREIADVGTDILARQPLP